MKTYRIEKKDLKNSKVLATGYKVFENDWSSGYGDYNYADEKGNVLNTLHTVEGEIELCRWGLHFCREPIYCLNHYNCMPYNKFAKVKAYEDVKKYNNVMVAKTLEIVEVYSFDEFIKEIKKYNIHNRSEGVSVSTSVSESDGVNWSNGINKSRGVHYSDSIRESYGISSSSGVNDSEGVDSSSNINSGNGINWSYSVSNSQGVNESNGVKDSDGICDSENVNLSYGVNLGYDVRHSQGVNDSKGVNHSDSVCYSQGVSNSLGVSNSYGVMKCEGLSNSLFCYNTSGKHLLFNKQSTAERIREIKDNLSWCPAFNSLHNLKGEAKKWEEVNIRKVKEVDNKTAWSEIPESLLNYITSLPEFDAEIWSKIVE